MTLFTMDSLEEAGSAAREFWEDDLETALEPLLARARRNGAMDEWIGKRTGRQVNVLCANLGTDGTVSVREKKNVLRSTSDDDLVPYLLVDQFAKFKSKVATIDFAKGVLTEDTLKTCRIQDDEFDKTALLFAIYHRRPEDLRVVFHLDKIHKSGFARMKLRETARRPNRKVQQCTKYLAKRTSNDDATSGSGRKGCGSPPRICPRLRPTRFIAGSTSCSTSTASTTQRCEQFYAAHMGRPSLTPGS